jgi:hypothetical protein
MQRRDTTAPSRRRTGRYTSSESARLADLQLEHAKALAAHAGAIERADESAADAIKHNCEQIGALHEATVTMFAESQPIESDSGARSALQAPVMQHSNRASSSTTSKWQHRDRVGVALFAGTTSEAAQEQRTGQLHSDNQSGIDSDVTCGANTFRSSTSTQERNGSKMHSIVVDTGASATTVGSDHLARNTASSTGGPPVRLQTATKSHVIVRTTGFGTLFAFDEDSKIQPIPTGRSLIDPRLHDLLSPASMFNAGSTVQRFELTRQGGHIVLLNGARIPLRWDGRAYWLDYMVRKNATDDDAVEFADEVVSAEVRQVVLKTFTYSSPLLIRTFTGHLA